MPYKLTAEMQRDRDALTNALPTGEHKDAQLAKQMKIFQQRLAQMANLHPGSVELESSEQTTEATTSDRTPDANPDERTADTNEKAEKETSKKPTPKPNKPKGFLATVSEGIGKFFNKIFGNKSLMSTIAIAVVSLVGLVAMTAIGVVTGAFKKIGDFFKGLFSKIGSFFGFGGKSKPQEEGPSLGNAFEHNEAAQPRRVRRAHAAQASHVKATKPGLRVIRDVHREATSAAELAARPTATEQDAAAQHDRATLKV